MLYNWTAYFRETPLKIISLSVSSQRRIVNARRPNVKRILIKLMKKRLLQFTFRNRQLTVLLMMYEIRSNGNSLRPHGPLCIIRRRAAKTRREATSNYRHIPSYTYADKARTSTRTDNYSDRNGGSIARTLDQNGNRDRSRFRICSS